MTPRDRAKGRPAVRYCSRVTSELFAKHSAPFAPPPWCPLRWGLHTSSRNWGALEELVHLRRHVEALVPRRERGLQVVKEVVLCVYVSTVSIAFLFLCQRCCYTSAGVSGWNRHWNATQSKMDQLLKVRPVRVFSIRAVIR